VFDLPTFTWIIDLDRVFFVKLANDEIWRLYLIDFEGAFTGITTFEYSNFGPACMISTMNEDNVASNFEGMTLFPNPANDKVEVVFDLKKPSERIDIQVVSMLGQVIHQYSISGKQGLNAYRLPEIDLPNGMYLIQLSSEEDRISEQLIINK